jgi:hypothetical protein
MSGQPTKLPKAEIAGESTVAVDTLSQIATQQIDEEFKISERLDSKIRSIAQLGIVLFGAAQTVLVGSIKGLRDASLSTTEIAVLATVSALALLSAIAVGILAILKLRHRVQAAVGMDEIAEKLMPHATSDPGDGRVAILAMQLKVDVARKRQKKNVEAAKGQRLFLTVAIIGMVLSAVEIALVSLFVAFS